MGRWLWVPAVRRDDERAPPPSLSCAAAKNLQTEMAGPFLEQPPCHPRSCHPNLICVRAAARISPPSRPMRGCARISACSAASSAIPCATRRAPTCSTWSSASGRPRSASTATTTSRRGASSNDPQQHVDRPDRADRPRFQLFFASRQHRRGSEQHPPDAGAPAAAGAPRTGRWRATLAHAREAGFCAADLRNSSSEALISPVLTAHPTEVRRKSTIDREMEVAALLDRRERVQLTPEEKRLATNRCAARC